MIDYSTVTETPGDGISREAAAMMRQRYALTAAEATGLDVLEISCGTGQGLGWLAGHARRVVGIDITFASLTRARAHYGDRIPLAQADAQRLPFADGSFDVVAIHEAIYYYPDLEAALEESRRVLRPGGTLLVSTINPEWADFNPSPFSSGYLSASALSSALERRFANVRVLLAFPASARGLKARALSAAKRGAVAFGLIPKTMKGKRLLKRLAFGELEAVPPELTEGPAGDTPVPFNPASGTAAGFKVIYAFAQRA